MGLFEIPTLKRNPDGILALVLGILLGPIGIIVTGVVSKHKNTTTVGIIQLVVAVVTLGLGAIWSVVWGILIFVKSTEEPSTAPPTA